MRVLVVVDVQKEFNKFIQYDLVDELYDYARKFDKVYQIWDTHKNDVAPTYVFPNQVDSIKKKYGKNHFSDKVRKFIKDKTDETFEGNLFKLSDNEGYIVRVDNNHNWFYVNPEIVDLIQKLKDDKVILVGGADNECLEDVYQAFKAFGLNVHINKKYVYSAKTTQNDSIEDNGVKESVLSEKINLPSDTNYYQLCKKINEFDKDWLLIRVEGKTQQQNLLSILEGVNNSLKEPLFKIRGAFYELDNTNINESYWAIPLKKTEFFSLCVVYSVPYSYATSEDFKERIVNKKILFTNMLQMGKVEMILNSILGSTPDPKTMYTPRKSDKENNI
jgi:hypothetical protein